MMEIWKPIKGYEGIYEVSNYGRVRSISRWVASSYHSVQYIEGRYLTEKDRGNGYMAYGLSCSGKTKSYASHRLVAEAFIPNPYNLPCVNHKDEDKTNNRADNLEWCDHKYNNNYGTGARRCIENRTGKYAEKPVSQYTPDGQLVKTYRSASEAQRQTGFWQAIISQRCRENSDKEYKSFIWKYA